MNKNLKMAINVGLLTLLPLLTFAQEAPKIPVTIEYVQRILQTLINWVFTIFLVVATFFIFYAAYLYLTAAGDPEKVKSANNQLIYAAVAIAVAFVAQGIRFLVQQLLGQ